jgi:hypothetical protein
MPGYLGKAMICFGHEKPSKIQNSPHPHKITQYGTKIQYAEDKDDPPPPQQRRDKISPGGGGDTAILWEGS